ncbi:MAG: hypothetical protein ACK559_40640, partial [bacterium]
MGRCTGATHGSRRAGGAGRGGRGSSRAVPGGGGARDRVHRVARRSPDPLPPELSLRGSPWA